MWVWIALLALVVLLMYFFFPKMSAPKEECSPCAKRRQQTAMD